MKYKNDENEYLDSYVADWLESRLSEVDVTLRIIELARSRVTPMEHMLKAIEAFAKTPGIPERAVAAFEVSLREIIDNVSLDYAALKGGALLELGRELLEPVGIDEKALKPKGYVKKDYKWVAP